MKILYIAHEGGIEFNGASRSLLDIIDGMIKLGNTVYVLLPSDSGRMFEEVKKRKCEVFTCKYYRWSVTKEKDKIINVYLNFHYYAYERIYNILVAKGIARLAKSKDIDIIHSNSSVINIGGYISKFSGIPHIWHFREFGKEDFNMEPLISQKQFYKFINKNSKVCIAISQAIYEKYSQYLNKDMIKIIYNGINNDYKANVVKHKEIKKYTGKFNVLISGRISEAKGQAVAINAINILIKQGYDIDLYVAGAGNPKILGILDDELSKHIIFLGNVDNLINVRSKMDIELMCSKMEAFGRVTIEAMLSYLPVIGSNSGGTKELIKDGYNGFLFKQDDANELASKINILINDKTMCEKMGENAFEFANHNFTKEILIKRIGDLYKSVLN